MSNYRIFVEKKEGYQVEALSLQEELNNQLGLGLTHLRLINVYDLFGFTEDLLKKTSYRVFGEVVTDYVYDELDLLNEPYLAIEYLPGQFDQRAASAEDCVRLIEPEAQIKIRSAKLILFGKSLSPREYEKVQNYCINAVESRKKNMSILVEPQEASATAVEVIEHFRQMSELAPFIKEYGLAMNEADLACVIDYFQKEDRDPTWTELRILDTYWSDHCRHTTFNTILDEIEIEDSFIKEDIENSLNLYHQIRIQLHREDKKLCLMDLACIGARYLKSIGKLEDLEESEENNACSIYIDVDVDGTIEKWLLQFKNETHNHPTEIEPFGGASTCLGGAIRDPLSGRAYVYQAMRVTGAGNIYADIKDTLEGKLPQRVISTKAAHGYSSYGNQMGLATTHVREIYHPGYLAKRLEVGAVVGAVKQEDVRRHRPVPGDIVLLLGGRTGRDGIGGATGSSKEHNVKSIELCSSEVQKGNALEERKLSHLFRRKEVTRLIKKANDFGAGGVSVAIGELADGLEIDLDKVPTKYSGLNATELAISESQERMAVIIEAQDQKEFMKYCAEENVEVSLVARVCEEPRLKMFYKGEKVVDIARSFIDSAGAVHKAKALIGAVEEKNPFIKEEKALIDRVYDTLADDNVLSQKGLIEEFDSTIGRSTVLMPFGGKTQRTETQVSVQKIPVGNAFTNSASMMAFGYHPGISAWSPYHGAMYAIVEAISKVVAAGGTYETMRFSFQEYFERMHESLSWGKPLASLLGALQMQVEFGLPSIGGKDSMSGTFQNLNVPPMLMAFGITMVDAQNVISPELKEEQHYLYLIKHQADAHYIPNVTELKKNYTFINEQILANKIVSAYALGHGGLIEALAKMSFGNEIGFDITYPEEELDAVDIGSIVVESVCPLDYPNGILLGKTIKEKEGIFNGGSFKLKELYKANTEKYATIYPSKVQQEGYLFDFPSCSRVVKPLHDKKEVVAFFPVFPGTNCDYDTIKAFAGAGAITNSFVFCNLNSEAIKNSILELAKRIDACDILVLSGGFSAGDEPDGSGKYIASILNEKKVAEAINRLLKRKGLILGICNGFQALIKSGLLPSGKLGSVQTNSPTLFRNDINRHVSTMVTTRLRTVASPWLAELELDGLYEIAVSHGEGKFVCDEKTVKQLAQKGQIAFQYVDLSGKPTMTSPYNPNGSVCAIEGIISEDGLILGKMGHTERYEENCFKNISGNKKQDIFTSAINYFKEKKENE